MSSDVTSSSGKSSRPLSGAEKVGVLLLALGPERATDFLKKFDAEELNIVMRSTEVMQTATAQQLSEIVGEFEEKLRHGVPFVGKPDDVKLIVSRAISEVRSAADTSSGGRQVLGFWPRVSELPDDVIVPYISQLHPQIVAFILQKVGAERTATLLNTFPVQFRNEVMTRRFEIQAVTPIVADCIEEVMQADIFDADQGAAAARTAMASILSNLEPAQSNEVLEHIAGYKPKDAAAIKKLIFKFSDLDKLPKKALTAIMDGMPVERVVVALTGMPDGFILTVLATLSPRARRMAEAELKSGAKAAPADQAASRRATVDAVLKLVADGELDLTTLGASEEVQAADALAQQ